MTRLLNYKSILKSAGEKTFNKEFFEELFNLLIKYYGEKESKKILTLMKKGKIKIRNREIFFSRMRAPFEPSNSCFLLNLTLLKFLQRVVLACKEIEVTGASEITLTSFFVQAYYYVKKDKMKEEDIKYTLGNFLLALCSLYDTNPYKFIIPDVKLAQELSNDLKIPFKTLSYCRFIKAFLLSCIEASKNNVEVKVTFSHILEEDYLDNIYCYLSETLRTTKTNIKEVLNGILDFTGPRNSEILVKLNTLIKTPLDLESILLTLKHIQETCTMKTYGDYDVLNYALRKGNAPTSALKNEKLHVNHSFTPSTFFRRECTSTYCEVEVDCTSYNTFEEASVAATCASKVALLKHRLYSDNLTDNFKNNANVKVIFNNIQNLSSSFVQEAEKLREILNSKYNREIKFCYNFDSADCLTRFGFGEPKYVRVISDIHADHPKNCYYTFNFGSDFVLNCGDIANDYLSALNWTRSNMTRGVIVPGNHAGYDYPFPEQNGPQNIPLYGSIIAPVNTRSDQLRAFSLELNPQVSLLNNSALEYQGITFLFTTLYSNFSLYGEKHKEECMRKAAAYINDYRRIFKTTGGHFNTAQIDLYTPQDTLIGFEKSMKFLQHELKKGRGKCIVIASHFAPLPYSIDKKYAHDPLNPYFVNDLRELFEEYGDRIRLWCHGHCIDDQTEVLTTEGWKTFHQIKQSDILLNLNTNTNKIEEDTIKSIISNDYTGTVYHFQSKGTDLRVTSQHDMLVINKKTSKISKIKAEELYNKLQKVIIRAAVQDKEGLNLSDDLLRLIVWISADGNRPNKNSELIRFNLHKSRKIERLKNLLYKLNIPFQEFPRSKGNSICIHFYLPSELRYVSFKPIDKQIKLCNQHQCDVVLEEYTHTDGVHNGNTIIIYTSKKEEADYIQLMCITNGYGCSIATRINHGFKLKSGGEKVSYELNIVKNPYRCIDKPHRTTSIENVSHEHFWCLSTNNGTLIVRRNGKVNITGNCHNPSDYLYNGVRVVACPFGYGNENSFETPYEYGTRISIADIKSTKPWKDIMKGLKEVKEVKL